MFVVEHVIAERWPVGHAPAGVNIASKEIVIGGTEMAEVRVISKEARVVEELRCRQGHKPPDMPLR